MSPRSLRIPLLALLAYLLASGSFAQEELPAPKPRPQPAPATASDCVDCDKPAEPWADVEPPVLWLRVMAPARASGEITYQVCVENRSGAAAHGVVLRGNLPAGARFLRAEPSPKQSTGELVWEFGSMPGGGKQCVQVVAAATSAGELKTCFRVSYEHGVCVITRTAAKPPLLPDESLPRPARLELEMAAPATASLATPIAYRITLSNKGGAPATQVRLVSRLPTGTSFVGASDGGQFQLESRLTVWTLGNLAAGQSRTVELKLRADQPGTVVHVVDAEAEGGLTARAEARTEVSGAPGLHLELVDTADPLLLRPNLAVANQESTSYRITVRNTGAGPATNLRLTAFAPPELVIVRVEGPFAHTHREGDSRVDFNPFVLPAGEQVQFRIECKPQRAGYVKFRVELTGDPLPSGPVREEESTNIVTDLKDEEQVNRRELRLRWHAAEPRVAEGPK